MMKIVMKLASNAKYRNRYLLKGLLATIQRKLRIKIKITSKPIDSFKDSGMSAGMI